MKIKKNVAISDSGFIFDAARGYSYSTNSIGVEIIGMLKQGKTHAEILKAITKNYQTEPAVAEQDLDDFIKVLDQFNLIGHEEEVSQA